MGVVWKGGEFVKEVRDKASRRLDIAAREVMKNTQSLLAVPGYTQRTKVGRRAMKWVAEGSRLRKGDDVLARRKSYRLGRGGKLRSQTLVWTGRFTKARKRSKLLGAVRSGRGEPPRKQTGRLRASIRVTVRSKLVRRIGTHVFYGKILEPTHPFLVPGLAQARGVVTRLF